LRTNNHRLGDFRRALHGTATTPIPVAIDLVELREKYPNLNALTDRAVAAIIAWRLEGDRKAPSALDVIGEEVTEERDQLAIGRAALAEAKADCRYWGVRDPDNERYCSTCREARPRSEFDGPTCTRCRQRRERGEL